MRSAWRRQLTEWLGPERAAQLEASLTQFIGTGVEFIGSLTAQLAQSGLTVLNTLAFIILTPVVDLLPAARLGRDGQRHRRIAAARAPAAKSGRCSTRSTARWPASLRG